MQNCAKSKMGEELLNPINLSETAVKDSISIEVSPIVWAKFQRWLNHKSEKPACKACGSAFVYVSRKEKVCRKCGFRESVLTLENKIAEQVPHSAPVENLQEKKPETKPEELTEAQEQFLEEEISPEEENSLL